MWRMATFIRHICGERKNTLGHRCIKRSYQLFSRQIHCRTNLPDLSSVSLFRLGLKDKKGEWGRTTSLSPQNHFARKIERGGGGEGWNQVAHQWNHFSSKWLWMFLLEKCVFVSVRVSVRESVCVKERERESMREWKCVFVCVCCNALTHPTKLTF